MAWKAKDNVLTNGDWDIEIHVLENAIGFRDAETGGTIAVSLASLEKFEKGLAMAKEILTPKTVATPDPVSATQPEPVKATKKPAGKTAGKK